MHYADYTGPWPWNRFTPKEIACRHCGEIYPGGSPALPSWFEAAMDALEDLREAWGNPIIVNSGHRCPEHNEHVDGKPKSRHLHIAFDCRCQANDQPAFADLAREAGFTGIGLYPRSGFVHLDMGPTREWREQ